MALGLRRPFDERWAIDGAGWLLATVAIVGDGRDRVGDRRVIGRSGRRCSGCCSSSHVVHALAPSGDYVGHRALLRLPRTCARVCRRSPRSRLTRRSHVWIVGAHGRGGSRSRRRRCTGLRDTHPGLASTDALATALHERGVIGVYSNYWTSYVLVWDDDTFIASPDIFDRRPDWSTAIRAEGDGDAAYVFDLDRRRPGGGSDRSDPRARRHRRGVRRRPVPRRDPDARTSRRRPSPPPQASG